MPANPAKDNGLPCWLTSKQCAELKQFPADVYKLMIAILLECREAWERDREREANRQVAGEYAIRGMNNGNTAFYANGFESRAAAEELIKIAVAANPGVHDWYVNQGGVPTSSRVTVESDEQEVEGDEDQD